MSTNATHTMHARHGTSWLDRVREFLRWYADLTERRILRDRPWLRDLPDRRR